jgi:hypothetical protein
MAACHCLQPTAPQPNALSLLLTRRTLSNQCRGKNAVMSPARVHSIQARTCSVLHPSISYIPPVHSPKHVPYISTSPSQPMLPDEISSCSQDACGSPAHREHISSRHRIPEFIRLLLTYIAAQCMISAFKCSSTLSTTRSAIVCNRSLLTYRSLADASNAP